MVLAQKVEPIVEDPRNYLTCIHGDAGVGKTTWCSQIDGHYFIKTEIGTKGVEVVGDPCTSWKEFLDICVELRKEQLAGWKDTEGNDLREIKVIIIDTMENLFTFCSDYVCKTVRFIVNGKPEKYDRIDDVPWGKGYKAACETLLKPIKKLILYGFGIILVSHTKERMVKWRGEDLTHYGLNLPPTSAQAIIDACDAVGYFTIEELVKKEDGLVMSVETGRNAYWQPTFLRVAKHRLENFPERIPLNNDPGKGQLGFQLYLEAFEQTVKVYKEKHLLVNEVH